MQRFVFWTGVYNIGLALGMAIPAIHNGLGIHFGDDGSPRLIAAFLAFTAATLIISSRNLRVFAPIVYWEAILRFAAFALLVRYGFFGSLGPVAGMLGVGDALIGVGYMLGLTKQLGFSHPDLFLARRSPSP